jgi:hypothetical protein
MTYPSMVEGMDATEDQPELLMTYLSMLEGVDAPDDQPEHGGRRGCS